MNKLKNPLVIVANGEFPTHHTPLEKIKKATSILACDGAADTLIANGYNPNMIIGDLDSISENKKKQFKDIIMKDKKIKKYLNKNELKKLLNSKDKITHIDRIFKEAFKI